MIKTLLPILAAMAMIGLAYEQEYQEETFNRTCILLMQIFLGSYVVYIIYRDAKSKE